MSSWGREMELVDDAKEKQLIDAQEDQEQMTAIREANCPEETESEER